MTDSEAIAILRTRRFRVDKPVNVDGAIMIPVSDRSTLPVLVKVGSDLQSLAKGRLTLADIQAKRNPEGSC